MPQSQINNDVLNQPGQEGISHKSSLMIFAVGIAFIASMYFLLVFMMKNSRAENLEAGEKIAIQKCWENVEKAVQNRAKEKCEEMEKLFTRKYGYAP